MLIRVGARVVAVFALDVVFVLGLCPWRLAAGSAAEVQVQVNADRSLYRDGPARLKVHVFNAPAGQESLQVSVINLATNQRQAIFAGQVEIPACPGRLLDDFEDGSLPGSPESEVEESTT